MSHFGIAGVNTNKIIASAQLGIAGIDSNRLTDRAQLGIAGQLGGELPSALKTYDKGFAHLLKGSSRIGDRAAVHAWRHGIWFADYTYIVKREKDGVTWRKGKADIFNPGRRILPLFLDSAGYRRELSKTAPKWAHVYDNYLSAIELTKPDGFAAWDYPLDRVDTMDYLHRIETVFPDGRLWPIFSIRWTWNDRAYQNHLPVWATRDLTHLIPLNKTQRRFRKDTREVWVRQAIANAIVMANDPDFKYMAEKHGKVMIGGMVAGPCPRMARHIFFTTLAKIYPDLHIWGLGQANFAVVNGLGMLDQLDRVWLDGSWWIKDATAERFAITDNGLITMLSLETGTRSKETFFTITEMMAANLRSLLAAYEGLITWPKLDWPGDLPLKPLLPEIAYELKPHYQQAKMELGL